MRRRKTFYRISVNRDKIKELVNSDIRILRVNLLRRTGDDIACAIPGSFSQEKLRKGYGWMFEPQRTDLGRILKSMEMITVLDSDVLPSCEVKKDKINAEFTFPSGSRSAFMPMEVREYLLSEGMRIEKLTVYGKGAHRYA